MKKQICGVEMVMVPNGTLVQDLCTGKQFPISLSDHSLGWNTNNGILAVSDGENLWIAPNTYFNKEKIKKRLQKKSFFVPLSNGETFVSDELRKEWESLPLKK